MNYDDYCPVCGGPPCDEEKHRRAQADDDAETVKAALVEWKIEP